MTAPKIAFVYLLNRMENAASAKEPFKAGYGEHRKAVVEHVSRIESELADARAALRECKPFLMRAGFVLKSDSAARLALVEKLDNLLAKQG